MAYSKDCELAIQMEWTKRSSSPLMGMRAALSKRVCHQSTFLLVATPLCTLSVNCFSKTLCVWKRSSMCWRTTSRVNRVCEKELADLPRYCCRLRLEGRGAEVGRKNRASSRSNLIDFCIINVVLLFVLMIITCCLKYFINCWKNERGRDFLLSFSSFLKGAGEGDRINKEFFYDWALLLEKNLIVQFKMRMEFAGGCTFS